MDPLQSSTRGKCRGMCGYRRQPSNRVVEHGLMGAKGANGESRLA